MKVLHIVTHLGDGVGRVLSAISQYRIQHKQDIEMSFICLEQNHDTRAINLIRSYNIPVYVTPSQNLVNYLIQETDITHIDWWNHPLMMQFMATTIINSRVILWSHTSGYHYPSIPQSLIDYGDRFLFTAPLS